MGVGDGQGGLVCCTPWGCKESDTAERLNWTELARTEESLVSPVCFQAFPWGMQEGVQKFLFAPWGDAETSGAHVHTLDHVRLFGTPWSPTRLLCPMSFEPTRLLCPWNSPGKNTRVGYHSLPQGISTTQGSNPGLLLGDKLVGHLDTWEQSALQGRAAERRAWGRRGVTT